MAQPTRQDEADAEMRRLVRAIRRGNGKAFSEFYDRYFDRCVALAKRTCQRDEDFCLDVVQDLMIKVANKLPALTTCAAVSSWLRRSLYTGAIDKLRTQERRLAREQDRVQDAASAVLDGPVTHAIKSEERAWIEEELAKLEESDRALLHARFTQSRTLRESGAQIGIGEDSAHGRIRRLLIRLRRAGRGIMENER